MGRLIRRIVPIAAAVGLLLSLVPVAVAASPASFGTPTASSTYGKGIVFSQPVTVTKPIGRAELLLTIADAISPTVIAAPVPGIGSSTLAYTLDTSGNDHLIPNTPIVARWRLAAADDPTDIALGPEVAVVYADDRFDWKTVSGDLVRVHWYKGDAAFGAKALKLGEDEVRQTSKLLGVTETEPADFFVYANKADFYGALGPGAHENVAGSAYASIRTLLGLIPPGQIDDSLVAVRIPHEFVHLVFNTAASNPYHSAPRWLNEGLAVYQSEGYGSSDRGQVQAAARAGTLIPLDGLTGQFPNGQAFFLAYAESVAAVKYMIDTHGSDALVTLIRSYAEGRTDDEAFKAALGLDMTEFGAAWFKDVNAKTPTRYGPQPAPPGPVPTDWTDAPVGAGTTPQPAVAIGSSLPIGGVPADPGVVGAPARAGDGVGWVAPVVLIVGALVVIAILVARRRGRASDDMP